MITYVQAATIIPKRDAAAFFERYGVRIPTNQTPSTQQVANYFRDVVKRVGEVAQADLERTVQKAAKEIGGCKCDGNCDGCGGDKEKAPGKKTSQAEGWEVSPLLTEQNAAAISSVAAGNSVPWMQRTYTAKQVATFAGVTLLVGGLVVFAYSSLKLASVLSGK